MASINWDNTPSGGPPYYTTSGTKDSSDAKKDNRLFQFERASKFQVEDTDCHCINNHKQLISNAKKNHENITNIKNDQKQYRKQRSRGKKETMRRTLHYLEQSPI